MSTTATSNGHANGKAVVIGDRHRKPPTRPIDPDSIHDGLKMFDRWLAWRWTWNAKSRKWDKPPIAVSGGAGSSTNCRTWSSFASAYGYFRTGLCDGVGFALGEADANTHFSGIDLDNCRNSETGELSDVARDIIATMNTYTEVSPSGTGIKLLCIGKLPDRALTKNKAGTVEVYSGGRYFTITGQRVEGTPKRVEERHDELSAIWQKYIGSEQTKAKDRPGKKSGGGNLPEALGDKRDKVGKALGAMLKIRPAANENDGSKRLLSWCCRGVEFNLSDEAIVATVRKVSLTHPFPCDWTDDDILRRIRDAEQRAERGATLASCTTTTVAVSNFSTVEGEADGKPKIVAIPKSMDEIIADVKRRLGDWPRRVDRMLFVDDPDHGLNYFDRHKTAGLFGLLRRRGRVEWAKGGNYAAQVEVFAEIERTCQRYDAIELLPHEPPIEGIYYRGAAPKAGDGSHLRQLLERFRPATTVDRDLIQAAMMTAFWGGLPGCRPVFVITSDDGRGVGKTKVAEVVGYLCGGFFDVSTGEDIGGLKTRFLTPEARTKRIALLDNVKTLRFSWAELEAMVTGPVISGKQNYVGEGQRPNLLTWFVTLNGVSMATDMAQRSVIIKVVKGANDGLWWEHTRQFIDQHREQIIGDIIGALRADPFPLAEFTRWATWEQHVLARLPEPGEAQRLIIERQGEANCELDEAEIVEDYFADQLRRLNYDPNSAQVRIPVAVAARWYGWALGEKIGTTAVSRKLRQMISEDALRRIRMDAGRSHGRCFIWTGDHANVDNSDISNDLTQRLAERSQDTKDA